MLVTDKFVLSCLIAASAASVPSGKGRVFVDKVQILDAFAAAAAREVALALILAKQKTHRQTHQAASAAWRADRAQRERRPVDVVHCRASLRPCRWRRPHPQVAT